MEESPSKCEKEEQDILEEPVEKKTKFDDMQQILLPDWFVNHFPGSLVKDTAESAFRDLQKLTPYGGPLNLGTFLALCEHEPEIKRMEKVGIPDIIIAEFKKFAQEFKSQSTSIAPGNIDPGVEKFLKSLDQTGAAYRIFRKSLPEVAAEETNFLVKMKTSLIVFEEQRDNAICCSSKELINEEDDLDPDEGHLPNLLQIVKLPMKLFELSLVPQILFFREDDFALFTYSMGKQKRFFIMGNPGVSKSVWQWKLLCVLFRKDLWDVLVEKNGLGVEYPYPRDVPDLIIRCEGNQRFSFFFVQFDIVYYYVGTFSFSTFDREGILFLWEPLSSQEPIPVNIYRARVIATVSPERNRYHEFQKNSIRLTMPCPSKQELFAMSESIINNGGDSKFYDKSIIADRISKFGPFIRYVLPASEDVLRQAERERSRAVAAFNLKNLIDYQTIEVDKKGLPEIHTSHFFLKYIVDRDHEKKYFVDSSRLKISSRETMSLVLENLFKLDLKTRIAKVVEYFNGKTTSDASIRLIYESIVIDLICTKGLKWFCRPFVFEEECLSDFSPLDLRLQKKENFDEISFKEMDNGRLYVPPAGFPWIDCLWKTQEGNDDILNVIQVSVSSKHPKSASVMTACLEKLKIASTPVNIRFYFVTHPSMSKQSKYTRAMLLEKVDNPAWEVLLEKVKFFYSHP